MKRVAVMTETVSIVCQKEKDSSCQYFLYEKMKWLGSFVFWFLEDLC